ncbi:hypothetical protein RclHR1_09310001, partial [Rhizophagus clarus]
STPTNTTPRNIATPRASTPTNTTPRNIATPRASTPTNTTPRNIATPRASTPTNTTASSTSRNIATPRNIASTPTSLNTNTTAPFRLVISQDILASLSQTQTQSQQTSDIIKRYPNINVPKSYCSHHEEGAPRNVRPSNEEAGNLELGNLKNETLRLQNELNQEKDKQYLPKRSNKRLKLREKSPNEVAASAARDEMKNLLKGQIPEKYRLDYGKTFNEQTAKIYEKLIPELKRLMSGHYNLSVIQLSN